MTNTLPSVKHSARSRESAVGQHHQKRSVLDVGMGLLTPLLGQEFLDRHHLRDPLNKALKFGVKHGFSAAGASTRQFKKIQGLGTKPTRLAPAARARRIACCHVEWPKPRCFSISSSTYMQS